MEDNRQNLQLKYSNRDTEKGVKLDIFAIFNYCCEACLMSKNALV